MNHKLVQGVLFVRHREQAVRDEDWDAMLADVAQSLERGGALKILVRTDNAGPNVLQRSKLNQVVTAHGGTLQVAVLSSSVLVRGIVTAFSWMRVVQIRSFGPEAHAAALAYLDVKVRPDAAQRVIGEIEGVVG